MITARLMKEEVTGVFRTIDLSGALVIETGDGLRALPAADVFF
ncbi:MAG TPA: hypothetical protein VGC31_10335 [Paenirhodobacter sp.]